NKPPVAKNLTISEANCNNESSENELIDNGTSKALKNLLFDEYVSGCQDSNQAP
ncbi:28647_t:CDS:1, partial [Gigaspora margarita]